MNEEIKKQLLESGEKLTEEVVEETFKLLEAYIKLTENKFDDLLLTFLPEAKQFILKYVDKIDGVEE